MTTEGHLASGLGLNCSDENKIIFDRLCYRYAIGSQIQCYCRVPDGLLGEAFWIGLFKVGQFNPSADCLIRTDLLSAGYHGPICLDTSRITHEPREFYQLYLINASDEFIRSASDPFLIEGDTDEPSSMTSITSESLGTGTLTMFSEQASTVDEYQPGGLEVVANEEDWLDVTSDSSKIAQLNSQLKASNILINQQQASLNSSADFADSMRRQLTASLRRERQLSRQLAEVIKASSPKPLKPSSNICPFCSRAFPANYEPAMLVKHIQDMHIQ